MSDTKVVTPDGMPSSDHPIVGWLWSLTSPTGNSRCTRPWTIERDGQPWTCATNGHIFALTQGAFGFDKAPFEFAMFAKSLPTSPPVPFPLAALRTAIRPVPLAELPPCAACSNTGHVLCGECDGDGETECSCSTCGNDHETQCDHCAGRGRMACRCGRVFAAERRRCVIGIDTFDLNLLAKAVDRVPDGPATWTQDTVGRAAILSIGAWEIIVMPLLTMDPLGTTEATITLGAA